MACAVTHTHTHINFHFNTNSEIQLSLAMHAMHAISRINQSINIRLFKDQNVTAAF